MRSSQNGYRRKVGGSQMRVDTRDAACYIDRERNRRTRRESGFLNTRHDTESGDTSAASPAGRKKSMEDRSPGSNSARVAASKLLRNGQGRTTGVITVTKPPQSLPGMGVFCV